MNAKLIAYLLELQLFAVIRPTNTLYLVGNSRILAPTRNSVVGSYVFYTRYSKPVNIKTKVLFGSQSKILFVISAGNAKRLAVLNSVARKLYPFTDLFKDRCLK